jgi:hypothetical protein
MGTHSLRTTSGLCVQKLLLLLNRLSQDPGSPFCHPSPPLALIFIFPRISARNQTLSTKTVFGIHRFLGPHVLVVPNQFLAAISGIYIGYGDLPEGIGERRNIKIIYRLT